MKKNKKLYEDAIADAKLIRNTALANAKLALEETFAPRIESMINAKLNEMEDDLDENIELSNLGEDDSEEEIDLNFMDESTETIEDDEFNLDEILAELEAEELNENEDYLAEKKKDEKEPKEKDEKEKEPKAKEKGEPKEKKEPKEKEEDEIGDLTVSELEDMIRGIVMDVTGQGGEAEDVDAVDLDLDGGADELGGGEFGMPAMGSEEEINIDELLAEIENEDSDEGELAELKTELNEAIKTIKFLKSEINEVNLLNSKLLYANKIFKSKGNLNEAQKVKVINSLDKATSTREAKLVYEALTESLNNTVKKSPLKESFSYASKPTGSTLLAKKPIIETDSSITRMQKLAGLL